MKRLITLSKIAFRNVFRNKRRSLLTMGAVFTSVAAMTFMNSYLNGFVKPFFEDLIRLTGHIQVQHEEYALKVRMMSLSARVENYRDKKEKLKNIQHIKYAAPRIAFGGLIDVHEQNIAAPAMGIDLNEDDGILRLSNSITDGRAFSPSTNEAVIGYRLQEKLNITVGDTVTIITRTTMGSMSAANLVITGIFDMFNAALNNMIIMPVEKAEYLLDMENAVTSLNIGVDDEENINAVIAEINNKKIFKNKTLIERWDEIGILMQYLPYVYIIKYIFAFIFGIIAVIGILNTMLMAVFERIREIGVTAAMGLKRMQIIFVFLSEAFYISLFGGIPGILFGGAVGLYVEIHGINIGNFAERIPFPMRQTLYTDVTVEVLITSLLLGIIVCLLGAVYPALKASRMQPAKAMRST
ncbi:ABC transporter permease [candidate division KSB1 bacterium]